MYAKPGTLGKTTVMHSRAETRSLGSSILSEYVPRPSATLE